MKHKVSELEGALLDAAVAKAEGRPYPDWVDASPHSDADRVWSPSDTWEDAGQIIELELIATFYVPPDSWTKTGGWWEAGYEPEVDDGEQCESGWIERPKIVLRHGHCGSTPLIAAMRAYVASKFGDEVELP
jgi:hypothetical protein